jgi:hypothetical protein
MRDCAVNRTLTQPLSKLGILPRQDTLLGSSLIQALADAAGAIEGIG